MSGSESWLIYSHHWEVLPNLDKCPLAIPWNESVQMGPVIVRTSSPANLEVLRGMTTWFGMEPSLVIVAQEAVKS